MNKSKGRELNILLIEVNLLKSIIDGKLKINNIPKDQIITGIESLKLDKIDDSYDYLLRMTIYSLTKEMYEKLKEEFKCKKGRNC